MLEAESLFVAEKRSALQEVQERLEAVQLGSSCLVLGSGANRKLFGNN